MVIISSVDDLPSSQPFAADAASRPTASNPESPLFDDLGTPAYVAAGTTAWNSYHPPPPPPYAPTTAPTSGAYNPSSLPSPTTFFPQPPPLRVVQPAMAEPSYYWYPPCFTPAPFVQGAVPPPVLVPMQITRVEPSYRPQTQGAVASAAEEAAVARAVPDTQKPQEATKPPPRRRGRPRKNATAAGDSKPVLKPPKRATARSNRAAASQQTTSVADSAAMAAQIQVQKPHQQAASSDDQTAAPCMNPTAALLWPKQWQLQPTCWTNAAEAMPMPPYAETSAAGVRFQPTDEELIFYLRLKHAGREMPVDFFKDLDVYHEHPETTKAACVVVNDFWYAFSPRDRKYKNGDRPARSVIDAGGEQVGYWKSNTKLAPVRAGGKDDGALIGKVTSLTFHLGRQPNGIQTPWKMKEYAIPENQHAPDGSAMRLNDWVVCKLFYKERAIIAAEQEDQLGEAGEDVSRAEGDEGSMPQAVCTDQTTTTLGSSEQDLFVEDYLGYDKTLAQ